WGLVLADYGGGKTTLLRRAQYELGRRYRNAESPHRLPVFVPLRLFRRSSDALAVVRQSLHDDFRVDLPPTTLLHRIQNGSLVLLLDGFDEMAERSDRDRRAKLFGELSPFITSASPVILSSRPG